MTKIIDIGEETYLENPLFSMVRSQVQRPTANILKSIIRSYLMLRDKEGVIGSEVMYGSSRRVADLVFISKGHSYAIEIKSAFDSTARLAGQLEEYQTLFDYVIIFSAPNHIKKITTRIPDYVGLYSIYDTKIQQIKRERLNPCVKKTEMLISIPSSTVKNDFSIKGKLTSDEIRAIVSKHSKEVIHNYFISYYKEKLCSISTSARRKSEEQIQSSSIDYIII